MPEDNIVRLENLEYTEAQYPELQDESPHAGQRRLKFGTLEVAKDQLVFDDGDKVSLKISAGGIQGFGTVGNTFQFYDSSGGTRYGYQGFYENFSGTDDAFWFEAENGAELYFTNYEEDAVLYSGTTGSTSYDSLVMSDNDAYVIGDEDVWLTADNDSSGSGRVRLLGEDTGSGSPRSGVFIYNHDSDTWVEKTAIIKLKGDYRKLYCVESPDVWFMDFVKGDSIKEVKKNVDSLFLEATEKPFRYIKAEEGYYQVWGKRKGAKSKRFEKATEEEYRANKNFWSSPKKKKIGGVGENRPSGRVIAMDEKTRKKIRKVKDLSRGLKTLKKRERSTEE